VAVVSLDSRTHLEGCIEVLASLPEWFGYPNALESARDAIAVQRGFVALEDERVVGFVVTSPVAEETIEITYLAVHADCRGKGLGRALVHAVRNAAIDDGFSYVSLLTLGPSSPSEHYAQTRSFYRRLGFAGAKELHITEWGGAPALVMVARLSEIV
jgi:ribosomal protein S18 acetylase RimI-like enzyme